MSTGFNPYAELEHQARHDKRDQKLKNKIHQRNLKKMKKISAFAFSSDTFGGKLGLFK